jgi:hypothetical protein
MKQIKFLFVSLAFLLIGGTVQAQEPLCAMKKGMETVYVTKDAKGKVQSYAKQTVVKLETSATSVRVTTSSVALDGKKKPLEDIPAIEFQYLVRDNAVIIDLKSMFGTLTSATQQQGEVEGVALILPADLQAGDKIEDANVKMRIAFMYFSAAYTEGVCEGQEELTTPAGTFNCTKIKQNCYGSVLGIKGRYIVTTWYAPGIGLVRQEMYTEKGKIQTSQELESVSQ